MASLLYRLGRGAARRRLLVVIAWLVVLIGLAVGSQTLGGHFNDKITIPGLESTKAQSLLTERFGSAAASDKATAQVVVEVPEGSRVTNATNAAKIHTLVTKLRGLSGVTSASNPLDSSAPTVSQDLRAVYSTVTFDTKAADLTTDQRQGLLDTVSDARSSGFDVQVSGDASTLAEGGATELIGVVIALVILAFTFGSLLMAGMNILTALIGVGIGSLGISTLSGLMDLSSVTSSLGLMLGLAVGIDYALFIITRFRQELVRGRNVNEAIGMAVGTAGSAVVTAGGTVIIALAGLAVVGIPFLAQMGFGAAATVVIAVLIALTLVPAVLGYVGTRALPKRVRRQLLDGTLASAQPGAAQTPHDRGVFARWARLVTGRRWLTLVAGIIVLAVVALPLFSMRTTLVQPSPDGTTQARAAGIIDTHFGKGVSSPLVILVDGDGAQARATTISEQASDLKDVAYASTPTPNAAGTASIISVIPKSGPTDVATENLVHTLRDTLQKNSGPEVYVTGTAAVNIDVAEKLNQALPIYILLVVGLALVLLIIVFRSILVPVTAVLGFLLTIGAALGAATAVFQWGWLQGVFHTTVAPINSITPILAVGVLFGLAMDYQVFLVSRMHEAHSHGEPARSAVAAGFRQAAPVVVAAAAIMFSVFAGFFPAGDATIKPIAFVLAAGVLFDAFVVRMLLIPAVLAILGDVAWRLPRWLRWLPELDVEGVALQKERPATGSVPVPVHV